jgi:hypothetical protein
VHERAERDPGTGLGARDIAILVAAALAQSPSTPACKLHHDPSLARHSAFAVTSTALSIPSLRTALLHAPAVTLTALVPPSRHPAALLKASSTRHHRDAHAPLVYTPSLELGEHYVLVPWGHSLATAKAITAAILILWRDEGQPDHCPRPRTLPIDHDPSDRQAGRLTSEYGE